MYILAVDNSNNAARYGHLRRSLLSIMMIAVYGRRIDRVDHEDIKFSELSGRLLGKLGIAGKSIEEKIPSLARLPTWTQPSKKKVLEHGKWVLWVNFRMWNLLQEGFDRGAEPSWYAGNIRRCDYDYASQGPVK